MSQPHRFSINIKVSEEHIDANKHVNNLVYLQWCLDVAEAHWNTNTTETLRKDYVWYVLNHFISYKSSAFEGDELIVETWVDSINGVKCDRHYKITRPSDNKTLVEANTKWCLLNSNTLRPTKITEEISSLF